MMVMLPWERKFCWPLILLCHLVICVHCKEHPRDVETPIRPNKPLLGFRSSGTTEQPSNNEPSHLTPPFQHGRTIKAKTPHKTTQTITDLRVAMGMKNTAELLEKITRTPITKAKSSGLSEDTSLHSAMDMTITAENLEKITRTPITKAKSSGLSEDTSLHSAMDMTITAENLEKITKTPNTKEKSSGLSEDTSLHRSMDIRNTAEHLESMTRTPITKAKSNSLSGDTEYSSASGDTEQPVDSPARRLKTVVAVLIVVLIVVFVGLMHFKVCAGLQRMCCTSRLAEEGKEERLKKDCVSGFPHGCNAQKSSFYHQHRSWMQVLTVKIKDVCMTLYGQGDKTFYSATCTEEVLVSGNTQQLVNRTDCSWMVSDSDMHKV